MQRELTNKMRFSLVVAAKHFGDTICGDSSFCLAEENGCDKCLLRLFNACLSVYGDFRLAVVKFYDLQGNALYFSDDDTLPDDVRQAVRFLRGTYDWYCKQRDMISTVINALDYAAFYSNVIGNSIELGLILRKRIDQNGRLKKVLYDFIEEYAKDLSVIADRLLAEHQWIANRLLKFGAVRRCLK